MLKRCFRKILLREKADPQAFVSYLRQQGMQIGKDVNIYSPQDTLIDLTAPWLISIGDHVNITRGVIILSHDYSWAVLKRKYSGRILGAQSPVVIGNNVFIGMNTIITRGVTVGDNVIIGAGSVVTHDCESDSVYAGNPARKIMTLEAFYKKREEKQFQEAKKMALWYKNVRGQTPPEEVFKEYFMLFSGAETALEKDYFREQLELCLNCEESLLYMKANPPMFKDYESFLRECYKED